MPALANTFLFVEPDDNYLNYASVPLHQIIEANKQAGQSITELMGVDANPAKIKEVLSTLNPLVFLGCGHGSPTVFTCQNLAPLLHAENSQELALMKERIVLLTSCLTAQQLGPALVDAGAVSYAGYQQEFWFYIGDEAGASRAVNSPFLAEFQFITSLLRGKSTGEARADQLAKYDEEIAYWTTGEGKNHADSSELAQILNLNKSISVFLGEASVSPSPQAGALEGVPISPAIPFAIAFASVGYVIYKTTIAK
jgi:hypothetical protein